MNLHESEPTHKPLDGQENPLSIDEFLYYDTDKFTVRRKGRDWRVELNHEFLVRWGRVLHPLTFLIYCMLEMAADWRKGPNHGNTGGHCTRADLARLAGTDDKAVRRALRELAAFGILTFSIRNPTARMKRGRALNMKLNQDALPPANGKGLSHEAIRLATLKVGAPTNGQNTPRLEGSNTPRLGGSNTPRLGGQKTDLTQGSNTPREIHSLRDSLSDTSSSTADPGGFQVSKERTTTTGPKLPDLTPIRAALPWIVDDIALARLFTTARAKAPDVTVAELATICRCKVQILPDKPIKNPLLYVLTAVTNALDGDGLSQHRAWIGAASGSSTRATGEDARPDPVTAYWRARGADAQARARAALETHEGD